MHGRKCLFLIAGLLLASCSSKSFLSADCHSCTVEDQSWKEFSWKNLPGKWKGTVETVTTQKGAKKNKKEEAVEFRFLTAQEFMQAKQATSCGSLPEETIVLNGVLWQSPDVSTYEAFVPMPDDKVAYGRLHLEKINGATTCRFSKFGGAMGKNRLNLPAIAFSDRGNSSGRGLASLNEKETNLEFLRFAGTDPKVAFKGDGRGPASVKEQARPALMIRMFQLSTTENEGKSQWGGSEEKIYRLWKN